MNDSLLVICLKAICCHWFVFEIESYGRNHSYVSKQIVNWVTILQYEKYFSHIGSTGLKQKSTRSIAENHTSGFRTGSLIFWKLRETEVPVCQTLTFDTIEEKGQYWILIQYILIYIHVYLVKIDRNSYSMYISVVNKAAFEFSWTVCFSAEWKAKIVFKIKIIKLFDYKKTNFENSLNISITQGWNKNISQNEKFPVRLKMFFLHFHNHLSREIMPNIASNIFYNKK